MKTFLSVLTMLALCGVAMAQTPQVSGDVDGDGSVTINDVTVLYNYILNGDMTYFYTSDVDGDGYVTSGDVTVVYNILLGIGPAVDTHEFVDLGLPSGTQWATMNIGANSPEEYGDHFAWGETAPKDVYDWSTYQWCMGNYWTFTKYCFNSSYGYNGFVDNKTELDPEDDAATVNWGPEWRMPSLEQIQELINNCTTEWTTRNGVSGCLFTSNINGASLFMPASDWGDFWSRTNNANVDDKAYGMYFSSFTQEVGWYSPTRYMGLPVRAVRVQQKPEHEYIDLGLPSGTLWATTNLGASVPEEYGDYFAWGETTPKDVYDWSTYKWCMGSEYTMTKYCTKSNYGYNGFTDGKTELDPEDDAATANWGAMWRMPSYEQIQELRDNCTSQWTTRNGVNGYLVTSNINGASLFLPAAGRRWGSDLYDAGSWGFYWSRTLYSSYPYYAYGLYFASDYVYWYYGYYRYYGFSVRPVCVSQN